MRATFTDDGNDESLTSEPADSLTAALESTPESYNGTDGFTFELVF